MAQRKVLHSWKDISNYTGRGVRILQRYEVQIGFPIHRSARSNRKATSRKQGMVGTCKPMQNAVTRERRQRIGRVSYKRSAYKK